MHAERPSRLDPRARRAEREACIARTGDVARPLVESYGDAAVTALNACSPDVGKKLAASHKEGTLDKLPSPSISSRPSQERTRDEVAIWALHNAEALGDPDAFQAFLLEPLEYVMELKTLSTGAAEARARRLSGHASTAGDGWRQSPMTGATSPSPAAGSVSSSSCSGATNSDRQPRLSLVAKGLPTVPASLLHHRSEDSQS